MIAIVDDYKVLREALEKLLRSLGHHTSTFGSAEDFLKSSKLHNTSCLITDVRMPGMSGIDLQDRLIADGHYIPIIFMTAYFDDHVRQDTLRGNANADYRRPKAEVYRPTDRQSKKFSN